MIGNSFNNRRALPGDDYRWSSGSGCNYWWAVNNPTPARNCASPTSTVTAASCLSPTCPTRTWPYLEALYRGRGRMECAIRDLKDTGLANLPSHDFAINNAWLMLVLIAADLLAWTKTLCLDGALAIAEPKRLRYTPLRTAAVLVRSARRTTLRLGASWPWATDLLTAFTRLHGWSASPRLNKPTPPTGLSQIRNTSSLDN
ncbi:transposase [Mycobacterium xenopi]|uniref:transposase n=1 Tax=Mycobacterium xenopi TaxID=1789 RepID=UPI000D9EFCFC